MPMVEPQTATTSYRHYAGDDSASKGESQLLFEKPTIAIAEMGKTNIEWSADILAADYLHLMEIRSGTDWLYSEIAKLDNLATYETGWDGYTADPPNPHAIELARRFLARLHDQDFRPDRIAASAVGGVGITFNGHDRMVYVEFYNTGLPYALFCEGDNAQTRPVRSERMSALVSEIKVHLGR